MEKRNFFFLILIFLSNSIFASKFINQFADEIKVYPGGQELLQAVGKLSYEKFELHNISDQKVKNLKKFFQGFVMHISQATIFFQPNPIETFELCKMQARKIVAEYFDLPEENLNILDPFFQFDYSREELLSIANELWNE